MSDQKPIIVSPPNAHIEPRAGGREILLRLNPGTAMGVAIALRVGAGFKEEAAGYFEGENGQALKNAAGWMRTTAERLEAGADEARRGMRRPPHRCGEKG